MDKPRIFTDHLLAFGQALAELQEHERPDVIAFGPATFAELKRLYQPEQPMDCFLVIYPNMLKFLRWKVEDDVPLGEFRYMKWVTEGGKRKLRIVKTVYVGRASTASSLAPA